MWRSSKRSYIRLLPQALGIGGKGYTNRLERAITDFGSERSFAKAVNALEEHYGFRIPVTAASEVTYRHARRITREQEGSRKKPLSLPAAGVQQLIAEADGCMIPIVNTTGRRADRRKNRKVDYREARLCACQASGSTRTHYEATFDTVSKVGKLWAHSAKEAGRGLNTQTHVVSDGAVWIHKQAEAWLDPHRHLVDFYHVCEYLGGAAPICATDNTYRWLTTQKKRLKSNRSDRVIESLYPHLERPSVPDEEAPVRRAHRYLSNRGEQLDYAGTLQSQLPIGSGLIESGHRHVIQSRLKIAGASWTIDKAERLLQIRTARANQKWQTLWNHN